MNTKRIALVTGGTRGIGAAIAKELFNKGYEVIATYHQNQSAADAFSRETGIKTYQWDVSDFGACSQAIEKITKEVGVIDTLVNNAGITRDGMFYKMTFDHWQDVIHTNLGSCFTMTRSLINSMIEKKFGRIINISSVNAQKGQIGQVNYCAAKAGILGFTKALAQETANKGITVNAIAPGYTDTDMTRAVPEAVLTKIVEKIPLGRLGSPEDVAKAASFLASEDASYITGATLSVNGGLYYV